MLERFPIAVITGAVLGFLAGLGIGGGSLLMLWLTAVLGYAQPIARGINLLFFLPAAGISSWFHLRQGALPWRAVIPAAISGCICAAAASWISCRADLELLKKLFGVLLIFTGLRELFYKGKG